MSQQIKLFYLYCTNTKCKVSIYHRMMELRIPLTAKNILGKHTCPHCDQPLVSSIDDALKNVLDYINSQKPDEANFMDNW